MAAIVLQLVLSFAHVHPLPISAAVTSIGPVSGSAPDSPDAPLAGDDCAICANIAAFAALDLPRPTLLALPVAKAEIVTLPSVSKAIRPAFIRYFPSRAPPSA